MVWIPYTEADRYKALAASAFEWRKKWESEFEFSFVEHVYRSEDRLAGQHSRRVKVIVIRSKLRYFKKLMFLKMRPTLVLFWVLIHLEISLQSISI